MTSRRVLSDSLIHKVKQHTEPLEHNIPVKLLHSLTLDYFQFKGSLFLIIYDHFTRFIVMKKCVNFSARTVIQNLLEVFYEHGVPSHIHSDRRHNFVTSEFGSFCKKLGIYLNFSSGYHHSANQAEHAMHTVKDLMKCCNNAGVHWCIALLEFLCTPGPDGHSPSDLLGRQFCGILPMVDSTTNDIWPDTLQSKYTRKKKSLI